VSRTHIPEAVRRRVAGAAGKRCGYCQAQEQIVGYPLQIDHIVPEAAGGMSSEENLWLACCSCNSAKGARMHALDPDTHAEAPLFNPREQAWSTHFAWSEDGSRVLGLTGVGRATVSALQLNAPLRVHSRARWVLAGWHPPRDGK
jgi:HNH endonuclease